MKVGLITYHNASNYGAVLQTFALQEVIKSLGVDVEIIDYDNHFITKGLDIIRCEPTIHGIYYFIHDMINYRTRKAKVVRFRNFFSHYYNLSPNMTKKQLKECGVKYDLGISGSDQIWNPKLNKTIDDIYFLSFPGIRKKISYASSFGPYHFDDEKENIKILDYLSDYSSISIRDNTKKLSKLVGKSIYNHCDPTLLLTREEWKKKLCLKDRKEKYLLVYCLTDFKKVVSYALEIGRKLGLNVITIGDMAYSRSGFRKIEDAGPKEFVTAFYNASYIVTNSFHGTAFAANFGVPFISVRNENSPERAESFLNKIKAESRLVAIGDEKCIKWDADERISIKQSIAQERLSGIEYLRKCIEAPIEL